MSHEQVEDLQLVESLAADLKAASSEVGGFHSLGLNEKLLKALSESGYEEPTPIQAQSIPILLEGRDLLGQAQTGTGKTAAFALPLLQRLNLSERRTQVLVLTPTRELAIQVGAAFDRYAGETRALNLAVIYGGQDYTVQLRQLDRGAQVVVGTPGRVMDHMRRGSLQLDSLKTLVLDEADEMLRMGFAEDVEWILQAAPAERQIALFSATMPDQIRRIAHQHLREPAQVTIQQKAASADTIRQRYVVAEPSRKESTLARVLEAEPIDGVIVFVKTKSTTEPLAEYLSHAGLKAAALNGDMPQRQRERIIEGLKNNKLNIIVATDVAARGLDVQRISHVINYDLPFDSEAYVHRIGRTGRAGRSGEAILFVGPRDRGKLRRLEAAMRLTIEPMEFPSNRTINKQRVIRFHERITHGLAHPELETFLSVVEQYRRDNDIPIEQVAAAMAAIAHGKKHFLLKDDFKPTTFEGFDRGNREHRPIGDREMRPRRRPEGKARPESQSFSPDSRLESYRVEVGHANQVRPGNIVGAIANEAGIDSAFIGRIEIFERFSVVDLPAGLPPEILEALANVKVGGRALRISRVEGGAGRPRREQRPGGPGRSRPTGDRPQKFSQGKNRFGDDRPKGKRRERV